MAVKSLKIAIATPLDLNVPAGVELHILQLAKALTKLGQHVTLCTPTAIKDVELQWAKLAKTDLNEFDIVHTQAGGIWGGFFKWLLNKAPKVRHVHTLHGVSIDYMLNCKAYTNWRCYTTTIAEAMLSYCSDHVIAVSGQIAQRAVKTLGISAKKVSMIFNGHGYVQPSIETAQRLRTKYGLAAEHKIALFIGRSEDKVKGAPAVIETFDRLEQQFPHLRLLAVPGTNMPKRDYLLRSGDVEHGQIDQFYAAADLFINASLNEGMPLTLIEAMAAKLPIVAAPVGGIPEIVRHGITGLLTKADRSDLTEQIHRLLIEQGLARRLAENGKQLADTLSWEAIAQQTLRAYRNILLGTSMG